MVCMIMPVLYWLQRHVAVGWAWSSQEVTLVVQLTPGGDEKKKPAARKSAGTGLTVKKKTAAQLLEEDLSDSAKRAIAAVEAAVKSLPSNKELIDSEQVTKMAVEEAGGWGGGGGAGKTPENHGNVEYPRGHPDCLSKVTIVISGVLDSMMRDQATDYIKRHGGRVTSGVTGKTTFLLCGEAHCLCDCRVGLARACPHDCSRLTCVIVLPEQSYCPPFLLRILAEVDSDVACKGTIP